LRIIPALILLQNRFVMTSRVSRRLVRIAILGGLSLTFEERAFAQGEPRIGHQAEDCWPEDQFPSLEAAIVPGKEILSAKVYFRSEQYPDFYFVEMKGELTPDHFLALLPKPSPETQRVIYYVEAIDSSFSGGRTEDYDPEIKSPCKRRAPGAYLENPEIVVGATKAGAAAIPPGFEAAGIVGFVTAAGVSSAVSGGLGVGATVAVAGAAAAAGGAVIVAGGDTTTSAASAGPPSTTSAPPVVTSTTTTTIGTSTTTVPSTTTSPSTTTTSVASTTTTAAPSPVNACFTATKLNSCVWRFDAACSTGAITQHHWVIDPAGNMPGPRPPVNHTGPTIVINWNPPAFGGCSGSPTITVQLTVVGSGGQTDTASQSVRIDLRDPDRDSARRATFKSFLSIPPQDGSVHGFLVLNDASRIDGISNSTPTIHPFPGRAGENAIEAHVETPFPQNGFWEFDFSATERFVPGSLRAQSGRAAFVDGRSIVFRLSGAPGERIRFSFELEP
jgi:hypothetical protein